MAKATKKKLRKALEGSIEKWRKIASEGAADHGNNNCPLCGLFIEKQCRGCPVAEYTGSTYCDGSPYEKWDHEVESADGETASDDVRVAIAWQEYWFLKELLAIHDAT